jgi:hypothetical protein
LGNTSNIDSGVRFDSAGDLLGYVPRAAEIGLFAPFPRMWFEVGTVGRMARIVAGIETLVMYLFYIPAAVCVWKQRGNLRMWLVLLFALTSMIGLGFVVANAGALFRLRYVFWMMMIPLAVKGPQNGTGIPELTKNRTHQNRTSEEGRFTPADGKELHGLSWPSAGVNRPSSLVLF